MEDFSLANVSKEALQRKALVNTTGSLDEATVLLDNAYVNEMAGKNIKDFKNRARSNVMSRVAKRIKIEEQRTKDLKSTITNSINVNKTTSNG